MIIIVEGIDRVGKSTLCEMLSKEFNIPVYKHIGDFEYFKMNNDNETDKFLQILQICKLTDSDIIFDRFHLTDNVYGIIERYYNITRANKNFTIVDDFISEMQDVFLIYVLPINIEKSSEEHGKDLTIYNDILYRLFKKSKIKNKYRVTYNTMQEVINFINANRSK